MMDTMEDKSLCRLIKFHSARLAEIAKDTEELQASIDNEVKTDRERRGRFSFLNLGCRYFVFKKFGVEF